MKIESRVEALEHELKILKNEIQNTLLEIREQLLNHYYPELRADEAPRPNGRPATSPRTGSTSKSNEMRGNEVRGGKISQVKVNERSSERSNFPGHSQAQVQPFSDLFIQDDEELALDDVEEWPSQSRSASKGFPTRTIRNMAREPEDDDFAGKHLADEELDASDDDDAHGDDNTEDEHNGFEMPNRTNAAPKLREVQYQQLKQAGTAPHPKHKPNQPLAQRPARRPFAALAAWVGDSVAKVGKERAVQVVETYAASGGNLADDTRSSLLQLIALANDVEPAAPASNQTMLGLMVELDHVLAE